MPPALALNVGYQVIESAIKASTTTAYAFFAIPCLFGITASVVAELTSAAIVLIKHMQDQPSS